MVSSLSAPFKTLRKKKIAAPRIKKEDCYGTMATLFL
jgi:hypothetical protein